MTRLEKQAGGAAGAGDSVPTPVEFLKLLSNGTTATGWVEFRFLKKGGKYWMPWPTHQHHPDVFTLDKAPAGKQVYFGVALRKDTSSGERVNCKTTNKVWAELDLKDFPEITGGLTKADLQAAPEEELRGYAKQLMVHVLELCDAHQLPPRAIVYSGHGIHVYWCREYGTDHSDTERFNRALAHLMGGDSGACDASRILRPPGTHNTKNPARPLLVTLEYADPDAFITDAALNALEPAEKDRPKAVPMPTPAPAARPTGQPGGDVQQRYAQAALLSEVEKVRGTLEGGRNQQLNDSAFSLGQFIGAGLLDEVEVRRELTDAAHAVGLEADETRDTLRSGLEAGKAQPRDLSNVGQRASRGTGGGTIGHTSGGEPDNLARPAIRTNGRQLRAKTTETISALLEYNNLDPHLFLKAGDLVRIVEEDEDIKPSPLSQIDVRSEMSEAADFVSIKKDKDGEDVITDVDPPIQVAQDVLSRRHKTAWPRLKMLARAPLFAEDGQLVAGNGYHRSSGIYLHGALALPELPSVAEAVALLKEVFCDFEFHDKEAATAHIFAGLVTPAARLLFSGPSPLLLIKAAQQGSGKSLATEAISLIATGGGKVSTQVFPERMEEQQKEILSRLYADEPVIILDNVKDLRGEVLASVLTSSVYSGRLLGASKILTLPNRAMWIASGNNPAMDNEMPRRIVPVRLKATTDRPEERDGFKHYPLKPWIKRNLPRLYAAVIALIRHWLEQGSPRYTERRLGGYEDWAEVIGGILSAAGIGGFLTDREELYQMSGGDENGELGDWAQLLKELCERGAADYRWQVREIMAVAEEIEVLGHVFADARTDHGKAQRLASGLRRHNGRILGGYKITPEQDTANNRNVWRVTPPTSGQTSLPDDTADF